MEKIKLFHFGACDLMDCLSRHSIMRDYDILTQGTIYPYHGTSLIALNARPSSNAERLHDYMSKYMRDSYKTNPVYLEVTKFPYFDYWKQNAGPYDIMVLNFSSELYTKFFTANEKFTVLPQFKEFEHIQWIRENILNNNVAHMYFDDEQNLGLTRELITDFANKIKEIFQDRVLLVSTNLTDKVFVNVNAPVTQSPLDIYSIPYYHGIKFGNDPRNTEYGQRLVDVLLRQFQRVYGMNLSIVTLEDQWRFIDANHKWGKSPLHLHSSSIDVLTSKIKFELDRIQQRYIAIYNNTVV